MMSFKISLWNSLSHDEQVKLLVRPVASNENLSSQVSKLIRKVQQEGDRALVELSKKFDGLVGESIVCDLEQVKSIAKQIDDDIKLAIDEAYERIEKFHAQAKPRDFTQETAPGVECTTRYQGYGSIGLYIPGGSAPLISTVLMTGAPANIAGVKDLTLCTPLKSVDDLNPGIAYAAIKCGVKYVFALGGAQAIAAMAYGTELVPRAQKIFGPGNAWVTEAKQQVAFDPKGAAIDMPAGPSEVMLIADSNANPEFIALDLLAQSEHGPDSQAIVLATSEKLLEQVSIELEKALKTLTRQEILKESRKNIRLVVVNSIEQAIDLSNEYAPEHLILQFDEADALLDKIKNSGSVFIGAWAPESLGDYCSGTNHVLPTYGFARSYNGLSTSDFMQKITFQKVSAQGIQNIGPCAMVLADAEGLDAHKRAVEVRLQNIEREEA